MIELPISSTLMISAAVFSSFLAFRIRDCRISGAVSPSPRINGITATPVSKPERPSASFGNSSSANASIITGFDCCDQQIVRPVRDVFGMLPEYDQLIADHPRVQEQVHRDEHDGQPDRFAETREEDPPSAASKRA